MSAELNFDVEGDAEVVGNLELPFNNGSNVVTTGELAFVSSVGGLFIIDVSAPDEPELVSQTPLDTGFSATDVAVSGDLVFLTVDEEGGEGLVEGLAVFDVSDPKEPELVSNIEFETTGISDIAVQDNVFLSSNPDTETLAIGTFNDSGLATLTQTLAIAGGASEVVFAPSGLAVVVGDIGPTATQTSTLTIVNPSTAAIVGSLDFTADVGGPGTFDPFGIAVTDDSEFAFVSGGFLASEVAVFDIEEPDEPTFVTKVDIAGTQAFGISLVDDALFVTSPEIVTSPEPEGSTTFDGFVTILDISDPDEPELEEIVPLAPLGAPVDISAVAFYDDEALAVAVSGDFSAAGGPPGGISVIEAEID